MADRAHILTDKELEKMERHLSAIYARAEKELSVKADKYFARFAQQDEKNRALVAAGDMTEQEYEKWRQGKIMTGKHWTQMKEQAAQELLRANETAQDYINNRLPTVYSLNYNYTSEGVANYVRGYSFELVDAATVKNLAMSDKTLLPYKYVDGKKDVRWNTKKVNSEILQGIIQGESIPKMAKRLRNVTEMNRASAIRNARTSVTSAENKGRIDSLHRAAEKGVIMRKVWLAASDGRVRESHAAMNGTEADIDKEFPNGLQYPGDPNGAPVEVYNCRCTLTYKVVGFGVASKEGSQDAEPTQAQLKADRDKIDVMWDMTPQERFYLAGKYTTEKATEENFFENSVGFWELKKRKPKGEPDHISYNRRTGKVSSKYWYTNEGVYRQSNHWGSDVASCSWYIEGRTYKNEGVSVGRTETAFIKWENLKAKGMVGESYKTGKYFLIGFKFEK